MVGGERGGLTNYCSCGCGSVEGWGPTAAVVGVEREVTDCCSGGCGCGGGSDRLLVLWVWEVTNFWCCGFGEGSDILLVFWVWRVNRLLVLWVWSEGCTEDEGQGGKHHRVSHQLQGLSLGRKSTATRD